MERSTAMKAYIAAYVVVLGVLVLFLLNVLGVLPVLQMPEGADPAGFAVPLAVFGVLMLAVIAAAVWWPAAPRRPWFWLVGVVPGVLFFLPDIPIIVQALTSPGSLIEVVLALVVTVSVVVLIAAAVIAFRDAQRASSV